MDAFENKSFSLRDEIKSVSDKTGNNAVGQEEYDCEISLETIDSGLKQEKGIEEQAKTSEETPKKTTDDVDNDDDYEEEEEEVVMNDTTRPNLLSRCLLRFQNVILGFVVPRKRQITTFLLVGILVAYISYVIYAMYYRFGDEGSIRLLVCTIIGMMLLAFNLIKRKITYPAPLRCKSSQTDRVMCIIRWSFYLASALFSIVFIVMDVAMKNPQNLICLVGLLFFVLVCCLCSQRPEKINWHTIYWCIMLQFLLALFILRTSFGGNAIMWITDRVNEFLKNAYKGSKFTFGAKYTDHKLIFGVQAA